MQSIYQDCLRHCWFILLTCQAGILELLTLDRGSSVQFYVVEHTQCKSKCYWYSRNTVLESNYQKGYLSGKFLSLPLICDSTRGCLIIVLQHYLSNQMIRSTFLCLQPLYYLFAEQQINFTPEIAFLASYPWRTQRVCYNRRRRREATKRMPASVEGYNSVFKRENSYSKLLPYVIILG